MRKRKIPNKETIRVIEDSEKGIGLKSCDTVEELFKELNGKSRNGRVIENDD